MKRAGWVAVMLVVAWSAASAESRMDAVVKLVETRYGVRHEGVPLLWVAKPFLLFSGVGGLKIAAFENLRLPEEQVRTLNRQIEEALGPQWFPFVKSRSRGEWSAIYASAEGSGMRMLIVTADGGGLSLLQMKVSGRRMRGWMDEPVRHAGEMKHGRSRRSQD